MKALVTGAAGMLAAELIPELKREGAEVFAYDINQLREDICKLDITNTAEVFSTLVQVNPDYVFHLAAQTDVDRCEQEPEQTFRVNTMGTENIALACQKLGVKLVFVSTAGVFGGDKKESYSEVDTPQPVNVYGESKLKAEEVVHGLLKEYFIVRAGWMIGGGDIDKKFVHKIIQQLKEGKQEIRAVADKFGSPTFTKDFARNLVALVKTGSYGIYHMTNRGTASKYNIALKIVELMNLQDKVKVKAVNFEEFHLPAKRAHSEILDNHELDLMGLNLMPAWEKSLEEYIKNCYTIIL